MSLQYQTFRHSLRNFNHGTCLYTGLLPGPSHNSSYKEAKRGYKKDVHPKVAVVTGASRGIGMATAKVLCQKLKIGHIYLTTRGPTESLTEILKSEMGPKADNAGFYSVEVTDIDSIVKFRNYIHAQHGKVDILINNAGQYFEPSEDPMEHFRQVQKTMATNYWGTKNICKAFIPMLDPQARIVNLSSHLGHVSCLPGHLLRQRFSCPDLTEPGLDQLVMEYQDHCAAYADDFAEHGWPSCAYTVSKVAVNAYTTILQSYLETHKLPDVVVNAIHPGSYHSKISQKSPLTAMDAAKAVVCCAQLSNPCQHPRGKFIWHDLQIIDWTQGSLKGMWA